MPLYGEPNICRKLADDSRAGIISDSKRASYKRAIITSKSPTKAFGLVANNESAKGLEAPCFRMLKINDILLTLAKDKGGWNLGAPLLVHEETSFLPPFLTLHNQVNSSSHLN